VERKINRCGGGTFLQCKWKGKGYLPRCGPFVSRLELFGYEGRLRAAVIDNRLPKLGQSLGQMSACYDGASMTCSPFSSL
jgi:hypothetical protein